MGRPAGHYFGAFDFGWAITGRIAPPLQPRFFRGDGGTALGDLRGDGELLDLRWWKMAELDRLNIVDVTWALIRLALARWQARVPVGGESAKLLVYRNDSLVLRIPTAPRRRVRGATRA
jgi:hypothetical protein